MISFFIPIKKISRRVRKKNIRKIFNYKFGLTEIKILQLLKFKKIVTKDSVLKKRKFEFIISSDDPKIENYLKKYSWIKFNKRPKSLSTDDCLDELVKYVPKICSGDLIIWTHVTSPFFDHQSYKYFIKKFLEKKNIYDSAFTAEEIKSFIYNFNKSKWISHDATKKKWPRTQDLEKIYKINHAAFIAKRKVYEKLGDRIGLKPLPIENKKKIENFDIDEHKDFNLFKKIIKKNNEIYKN